MKPVTVGKIEPHFDFGYAVFPLAPGSHKVVAGKQILFQGSRFKFPVESGASDGKSVPADLIINPADFG